MAYIGGLQVRLPDSIEVQQLVHANPLPPTVRPQYILQRAQQHPNMILDYSPPNPFIDPMLVLPLSLLPILLFYLIGLIHVLQVLHPGLRLLLDRGLLVRDRGRLLLARLRMEFQVCHVAEQGINHIHRRSIIPPLLRGFPKYIKGGTVIIVIYIYIGIRGILLLLLLL